MTFLVPSAADDPVRLDALDAAVLQVHVRLGERAVVAVGEGGPLTTELVIGSQPAAQVLVANGCESVDLGQVRCREVQPVEPTVMDHCGVDHDLVDRIRQPAKGALRERHPREQALGALAEAQVDLRHHPDRGALVHRQVGNLLHQLRDELHGGGTGADDGHPATLERVVVLPVGGMDDLAREAVDPRDLRHLRLRQEARRRDQVARGQRLTVGKGDPPDVGVLVPPRALDDGAEPHVLAHAVLVGDVVGVLLDLRSRREQPRPVRVRLEEVRVRGGGHVYREARIVVDVPGPAEVVLALEDHEVVDAEPLELNGCADSREPGPHDDRVELLRSHGVDGTSGTG